MEVRLAAELAPRVVNTECHRHAGQARPLNGDAQMRSDQYSGLADRVAEIKFPQSRCFFVFFSPLLQYSAIVARPIFVARFSNREAGS